MPSMSPMRCVTGQAIPHVSTVASNRINPAPV